MNDNELDEVLQLLGQAGIEAQVCDTPVPLSGMAVKCGKPTVLGDSDDNKEFVMMPKALLGLHPEYFVTASGDSMTGANFEEGDRLRVQIGVPIRDGDNVLAWIDGSCTVKTYFRDDDGLLWLVPQNERYDAILLTGEYDVRILGRIVGVEKVSPRSSFRDCQQYVRRAKAKKRMMPALTPEQVDNVICEIGEAVKQGRQWYAVFRSLIDFEQAEEGLPAPFCERVALLLPHHGHLPTPKEMLRMAVQSFSKPVAMWNPANAPVSGVRYNEYLSIAHQTAELLKKAANGLPF
jgi:hypothetical protein